MIQTVTRHEAHFTGKKIQLL